MSRLDGRWIGTSLTFAMGCLFSGCSFHGRYGGPGPGKGPRGLRLEAPGTALEQPDTLRIAARLRNADPKTALTVTIDSIQLESAPLLTPTPVSVGEIAAGDSAIVQ